MDGVLPKFHLLHLPQGARRTLMRRMELECLFLFSLCSKSTKLLVKSSEIKAEHYRIDISSTISIEVSLPGWRLLRIKLYPTSTEQWVKGVDEPIGIDTFEKVELEWETADEEGAFWTELEDPGFTVRQWIDHFMCIYNYPKIKFILFYEQGERFDTVSLREMVKGLEIDKLGFDRVPMNVCYKLVSETFLQAKGLVFYEALIESYSEYFQKIVIQNLESLGFLWAFRLPLQLPDLFSIRIPGIRWLSSTLSDQDLNRFLKLWIAGCNTELEYIKFDFERERILSVDTILSGVNHRVMGAQEQRAKIVHDGLMRRNCVVKEGYVIRRKDGVEATITMGTHQYSNDLQMVVWA